MSKSADKENAPWYRHVWVWLLMIPPAGAVIGGFLTAWLAGGPPALVVDDYSEIALTTERRQARDGRARELGLLAKLSLTVAAGAADIARVQISASSAQYREPEGVELQLIHPTREELDQSVVLTRNGDGYAGSLSRAPTRLYVQLADLDGEWRLIGELPSSATTLEMVPSPAPGATP